LSNVVGAREESNGASNEQLADSRDKSQHQSLRRNVSVDTKEANLVLRLKESFADEFGDQNDKNWISKTDNDL
jgi:hypothetical protein